MIINMLYEYLFQDVCLRFTTKFISITVELYIWNDCLNDLNARIWELRF